MATLHELRARLDAIGDAVKNGLPDVVTTLTLSAKALAERRTKDKGFGAMYSDVELPASFFDDSHLSAAGKSYVDKAQDEGDYINWKGIRAAQGLQTGHVDLSYTNKMWANMQPGPVYHDGDIIKCNLAASNTEAQNKMNWNRDRYGNFIRLALTKEDDAALGTVVMEGIREIINNANLI